MSSRRFAFALCATLGSVVLWAAPLPAQAQSATRPYTIGFSQLSFDDPWRVAFNAQMQRAVAKHPNYRLLLVNAQRDSSKQVADVENFITQKVDALVISPNEAAPLTAVVKRAYDKGIPVVVLDRNVLGEGYTTFIGADNKMIGKKAGEYVARWCADKQLNPCQVLEVTGLSGSTPAQERGAGFREGLKQNANARIGSSVTSEWQKAKAVPAAAAAFQANKNYQVVYAHNDDSAEGAYIAARNANLDLRQMLFLGIDGLPDKNGALVSILQGRLGASFVYPNGAAEAVDWISRILEKGEKPPKKIVLGTEEITAANAKDLCAKYECEAPR
jgi:ribose transport system substrate-binding protein